MKKNIFISLIVYLLFIASPVLSRETGKIVDGREQTQKVLEKIADRILSETTYQFIDTQTGKTFQSTKGLPLKKTVKVESRYNDWHYAS